MEFAQTIDAWLGQVVMVGGTSAAIAFGLFRWLGAKWLETRFAQRLEMARHDNAKELERLKIELDGMLRSKIRLQEKQFEAILAIWEALKEVQSKLIASISPLQSYPNIRDTAIEDLSKPLASLGLTEFQIKEVIKAGDRQKVMQKMLDFKHFGEAAIALNNFDQMVRSRELFFEPEVYTLIREVSDMMHSSLVNRQFSLEENDLRMGREAWTEYEASVPTLISDLVFKFRNLLDLRDGKQG